MTEKKKFHIRFEGLNHPDANKAALELKRMIETSSASDILIDIIKEDSKTQDFGSTLLLVLGTPAAIAVAKGISSFIAKWGNRVVIETTEGKVVATGDGAANIDVAKTAAALRGQPR